MNSAAVCSMKLQNWLDNDGLILKDANDKWNARWNTTEEEELWSVVSAQSVKVNHSTGMECNKANAGNGINCTYSKQSWHKASFPHNGQKNCSRRPFSVAAFLSLPGLSRLKTPLWALMKSLWIGLAQSPIDLPVPKQSGTKNTHSTKSGQYKRLHCRGQSRAG